MYFFKKWIGMFPVKAVHLTAQHLMPSRGARDAESTAAFLQRLLSWVLNLTCLQSPNILKHHPFPSRTPCTASSDFWQADVLHPEIFGHDQAPSGSPHRIVQPVDTVGFDMIQEKFLGAASCTSVLPRKSCGCNQFLLKFIWKADKINEKKYSWTFEHY